MKSSLNKSKLADDQDLDVFDKAIVKICSELKVSSLRKYQQDFFHEIYNSTGARDVFISQPTGSGKSLLFQAFPTLVNSVKNIEDSIVIVISPLVALMKDQCESLRRKGLPAYCLSHEKVSFMILIQFFNF